MTERTLFERLCEVVTHLPGCPGLSKGDKACTCDAVAVLDEIAPILAAERTATGGGEPTKAASEAAFLLPLQLSGARGRAFEDSADAARQYAAIYPEGSDQRNTFGLLAKTFDAWARDALTKPVPYPPSPVPAAAAPAVPAPDKPLTPADIPIRPEGYSSEELRILDPINPAFFDAVRPAPDKAQEERAQEVMTYIGFLIYVDGMKKTAETFIQGTARIAAALSTAHASGREEGERARQALAVERIREFARDLGQGMFSLIGPVGIALQAAQAVAALPIPSPAQERE